MTLPFTAKRKNRPSPDNMTLGEHLGELRRRVIICVIAFAVAATVAVDRLRADPALPAPPAVQRRRVDRAPHRQEDGVTADRVERHAATSSSRRPSTACRCASRSPLFGGLVLASPVILLQIWRFITPGLKATERRYAIPFVAQRLRALPARCGDGLRDASRTPWGS